MPKFRNYQTNFSGGLLSEGMLGRLDLAQYENGCKDLDNWWPKVTGGMRRRPGSEFLKIVEDAHRIAAEIGGHRTIGYEGFGTGVVADIDELTVPDDNRFSPGLGFIDRVDLAVSQHPVGR